MMVDPGAASVSRETISWGTERRGHRFADTRSALGIDQSLLWIWKIYSEFTRGCLQVFITSP